MPVINYADGQTDNDTIVLTDNSTVLEVDSGTATQSGAISQTGGSYRFEKTGAGILILTGDTSNDGGVIISAGTLQIGNGGTAGSLAAGGGSAGIIDNGNLAFDRADNITQYGTISGTGTVVMSGAGSLTLIYSNTYSGGTILNSGTLNLFGDNNLGAATAPLIFDGGAIAFVTTTADIGTLRPITIESGGAFFLNQNSGITITQAIDGSGALTEDGFEIFLLGDNSYSGGTIVKSGTVYLGNGGTTGMIAGNVSLGTSGSLTFDRSDAVNFTGAISGSGNVTMVGSGTLTLAGANSYTGTTSISSGTFLLADPSGIGQGALSVTAGGTLKLLSSLTLTNDVQGRYGSQIQGQIDTNGYDAVFSGDVWGLNKIGSGTLTLTGDGSFVAAVSGGTLQLGNGQSGTIANYDIIDNANIVINYANDQTYDWTISGTGSIVKLGNNTLILDSAGITTTGTTTIAGGTLQLGNNDYRGTVSGNIVDNGTLVLDHASTGYFPTTLNGVISGTGSVHQEGLGTWSLSGANTYSGGTIIDSGTTLTVVPSGAGTGAIIDNGFLTISGLTSDVQRFANDISGSGTIYWFLYNGVMTGISDFTGNMAVEGNLAVDGSLASSTIAVSGYYRLGGTGTVGATDVLGNATLAPGDSALLPDDGGIGTLHVNGALTLEQDSRYFVDISGTDADAVIVSGAVTVSGGLFLNFASGTYMSSTTYTVLQSDIGLSGTFANVTIDSLPVGMKAAVSYVGSHVNLTISFTAASDFSGDGKSDILWQSSDGSALVWQMNGATLAGGGPAGNPGKSWRAVGSADFNGDGKADILWQNTDGTAAIWNMNGATVSGGGIIGNPGAGWTALGTADFDGDGRADILWQNSDGTVAVWTMTGTTVTGGDIVANPGAGWHYAGTGDFDGDSKADILWQNDNGQVAVWQMNGAAVTGGGLVDSNPGASWHVRATGDFDGDGKADILWQNDDGTVAIWTMSGSTVTGGGIVGNPGANWTAVAARDFNGDGKADILWQNSDGSTAVWLMNGTTVAGGGIVASNPGTSWHIVTG